MFGIAPQQDAPPTSADKQSNRAALSHEHGALVDIAIASGCYSL